MSRLPVLIAAALLLLSSPSGRAEAAPALSRPIGALQPGAILDLSREVALREPDGPRGHYKHGFRLLNDSAAEWQSFYGVQFEVKLPDAREVELKSSILRFQRGAAPETPVTSTLRVNGEGWHPLTLPWSAFDFEQANTAFLKAVKEFRVAARFTDGQPPGQLQLRNARVVQAPGVALECAVRGKAAPRGGGVEYEVRVGNCAGAPQSVTLSLVHIGWDEMVSSVEPSALLLAPGQRATVKLRVQVSDRVPPGGHETQVLQALANGDAAAARLRFITTSQVPNPFILHTAARWQEVREKAARLAWAQEAADEFIRKAAAWKVPEVATPDKTPDDTYGPYLFATTTENDLMSSGFAWQLTGEKKFAEKVALYLRRLSNPTNGYPATLRACNQSLVQEGHYFQHLAMAYDMALNSGVLSLEDRRQIETTFRLFIETIDRANDYGPINNWNVSEVCGAFYCALAMQDLATAERFFSGPAGICDQLAKGVMDDGWWYECSISYNTWVASEFTQAALAYEPFGINFRDMKIPASFSPRVMLAAELSGGAAVAGGAEEERGKPFGMESKTFGPNRKPYRCLADFWNSLLPFLDYRSVMIGVNDSTENVIGGARAEIGGSPIELAYYVYRDPAYAAILKHGGGKRDLLFGVPELPDQTPEHFRDSAYADNVGLAMLRSQTTNRPIREQIQAALHYGTHGWAHGHFDRTDLLSIMRYGRSFWNPESVFWVYEPFMYKFFCQCSVNHNMVVVDRKMQEAKPGARLLFHSGAAMQATVVETEARWCNPPYGGMVYDYVPVKSFAEKCWREGRSVPLPANPPAYGTLTAYTEKIRQRRALIVTDDYVVLADWVKGTQTHSFESLLHMKDFRGLEAAGKKFLRHDGQWETNPVGSAQFVTDCDWYEVTAPAKSRFQMRFGPGADNEGSRTLGNEDGVLKTDVYSLWPPRQQIMIGAAPEFFPVEKRLFYTVRGDGKILTEGKFGAWILGSADIDVPLDGVKRLELETRTELSKKPTLFWANARVVTADGKEIPLSALPVKFENMELPREPGKDYFGGPIKIVGRQYQSATPAQPRANAQPALVRVDLAGAGATRFKATLGGDFPLGDETQRRKVYAVRAADGAEARFLTIIEPYEDQPMIKSAVATSADAMRVELADGRVQELSLQNFDGSATDLEATLVESLHGQIVRRESARTGDAAAP